jgi:hypothetical protein
MEWCFSRGHHQMTRDGKVDLAATQHSIERLVASGVSGLTVLPKLGENASLSLAERENIIRAAVEVVLDPINIGGKDCDTHESDLTRPCRPHLLVSRSNSATDARHFAAMRAVRHGRSPMTPIAPHMEALMRQRLPIERGASVNT